MDDFTINARSRAFRLPALWDEGRTTGGRRWVDWEPPAHSNSPFTPRTSCLKSASISLDCSKASGFCLGWSRRPQGKGKPGHGASQTCLPRSRTSHGVAGGARSALRRLTFHFQLVEATPCSHKNPGSKSLLKRLKNLAPNPLLPQTKNSALFSLHPRPKSSGPSPIHRRTQESRTPFLPVLGPGVQT